jgi:urease accessory protein UreE
MWCERVLGNLGREEDRRRWESRERDQLSLQWQDCLKRALRKVTAAGTPTRIVLPAGVRPDHDDVLNDDGVRIVVVAVEPTEVLVASPMNAQQGAELAWQFGSQHLPTQICHGKMLVIPDGPAEAAIHALEVPFSIERRRFRPNAFLPPWELA